MIGIGDFTIEGIIASVVILLFAIPIHEFAHAYSADQLGDDTPRLQGRVTLNPLAHLDLIGSILILLYGFGWGKPVQINPYALERRSRAGVMLVAAAGPFSNLVLALIASIPFQLGLITPPFGAIESANLIASVLRIFISINLLLLFFNLIPIFPLDGEKVLMYFLPPRGQEFMLRIRPYGMFMLFGLILLGSFIGLSLFNLIALPTQYLTQLLVY
jgi:Zn-dependent protease